MIVPVLDLSALDALARCDIDAIAPAEFVAVVTDDGESVFVAEPTVDEIRDRYAGDPFALRELGELLARKGVNVARLLPEQMKFAQALTTTLPGVTPGAAAAYILVIDLDGELVTYDPATAMHVVPPHMINDLGRDGDEPTDVWPV